MFKADSGEQCLLEVLTSEVEEGQSSALIEV
jgi:hypothetical protein